MAVSMAAIVAAFAAVVSQPAFAHHAFSAEYDGDKPFEFKGIVTKAKWVNPHSWLYADVKDKAGNVTNWGFEFAAPNALQSKGLSKADFVAGAEITVKGFYSKSGQPYGYASSVTLPDGRTVQTGGAADTPPPPSTPTAPNP